MRDIALLATFSLLALYTFKRPYVGVLLMAWIGYMNPHRLTWGFAYTLPLAAAATACTLIALTYTKERSGPPNITPIWIWCLFMIWVTLSTQFALYPEATGEFTRFMKIQLGILLTLIMIRTPQQIKLLTAVIAFSIGFYGIKGGIFTVLTGGGYRVWGPAGSFIAGNNELALALLMIVPLIYYFRSQFNNKLIKYAVLGCTLLCVASIIGSYSRGALLGLISMLLFLWWKSSQKFSLAVIVIALGLLAVPLLPDHWFERMETIQSYEEDQSANSRFNSWITGYRVAQDYIFGGGFGVYQKKQTFFLYAPNPDNHFDAHSIYFEIIGEQGFIGLALFLLLWFSTWRCCSTISKRCQNTPSQKWASDLAKMIQVSLIAYATGGAFLGLAYWDLPYHLMAITAVTYRAVMQTSTEMTANQKQVDSDASS